MSFLLSNLNAFASKKVFDIINNHVADLWSYYLFVFTTFRDICVALIFVFHFTMNMLSLWKRCQTSSSCFLVLTNWVYRHNYWECRLNLYTDFLQNCTKNAFFRDQNIVGVGVVSKIFEYVQMSDFLSFCSLGYAIKTSSQLCHVVVIVCEFFLFALTLV